MTGGTPGRAAPRLGFVILLILAVAVFAVYATLRLQRDFQPVAAAPPASASHSKADLEAELSREVAQLIGATRPFVSIAAQADTTVSAIMRGDFGAADTMVQRYLSRSRIAAWHFKPFNDFINGVSRPGNSVYLDRLDQWVAQNSGSATPYLLRAIYRYGTGWRIRGDRFAHEVEPQHMAAFQADTEQAAADAAKAAQLDPSDPFSVFLRLEIMAGHGDTPEVDAAFKDAVRKFPNYYPLYRERLHTLEPKWGGSTEQMYRFVDTYAGKAAADSPLKMLYLELYNHLLNVAAIGCDAKKGDGRAECVNRSMSTLVTDALEKEVSDILEHPERFDRYEFSLKISDILYGMVFTNGGERHAGALLQLAADGLGSDNQLDAPDTSKNNFMMDRLTALVWYHRRNYQNAETMFRRAIADLAHTDFPSRDDRISILAWLYRGLADVYERTGRYKKVVVYHRASSALRSLDESSLAECATLYRLKLYPDAVKACTRYIAAGGTVAGNYWRARAYEASHLPDKALADYARVADSENGFRTSSAIDISVIYGNKHDMRSMLKALNRYTYLYDPDLTGKEDLAIAFNNRCYARMHLGDLDGALKDCTASLQYGSLPDAYQKQQELFKRLKAKQKGA